VLLPLLRYERGITVRPVKVGQVADSVAYARLSPSTNRFIVYLAV
jgi:hypothetical protein